MLPNPSWCCIHAGKHIWPFNLETAVGREKDVHALDLYEKLDVHGRFEKLVVTLLVMRAFSNFPGALRACAYFRDPTADSRIMCARTKSAPNGVFGPLFGYLNEIR